MEKDIKDFRVVEIIEEKSGTNPNQFTGNDEHYITCKMEEVPKKGKDGVIRYTGKTIGYTFNERKEGGWIILLNKLREEKIKLEELPIFEGFIHEETTQPFLQLRKDKDENPEIINFTMGDDEGKPIIFTKYRMLLSSDADPKVAVNDYLNSKRVKLLDEYIAEGTALPEYEGKTSTIIELWKMQSEEKKVNKTEKVDD